MALLHLFRPGWPKYTSSKNAMRRPWNQHGWYRLRKWMEMGICSSQTCDLSCQMELCVPHCERMIRLYLLDDMHMQQLQRISLHIYVYIYTYITTDNRKFSLSYMTIVVARHQRSISREDFWLRLELNIQLIFEVSTPILNSLPIVGITKVQHGTQICECHQ